MKYTFRYYDESDYLATRELVFASLSMSSCRRDSASGMAVKPPRFFSRMFTRFLFNTASRIPTMGNRPSQICGGCRLIGRSSN